MNQNPLPKDFTLRNGILIHEQGDREKLVLSKYLLPLLMHHYHRSGINNHLPPTKILERVKEQFYHPDLPNLILNFNTECVLCITEKPKRTKKLKNGKKTWQNSHVIHSILTYFQAYQLWMAINIAYVSLIFSQAIGY